MTIIKITEINNGKRSAPPIIETRTMGLLPDEDEDVVVDDTAVVDVVVDGAGEEAFDIFYSLVDLTSDACFLIQGKVQSFWQWTNWSWVNETRFLVLGISSCLIVLSCIIMFIDFVDLGCICFRLLQVFLLFSSFETSNYQPWYSTKDQNPPNNTCACDNKRYRFIFDLFYQIIYRLHYVMTKVFSDQPSLTRRAEIDDQSLWVI